MMLNCRCATEPEETTWEIVHPMKAETRENCLLRVPVNVLQQILLVAVYTFNLNWDAVQYKAPVTTLVDKPSKSSSGSRFSVLARKYG